ncbi:vanadium-dependent haloperoxidase [Siphonobacter sp.]|uniref:vanadium-dependent haloperoxidase n=1 Tax=Siphonobacter sp. TaxID=1869184 RepID=UPI003B3B67B3
MNHCKLFLLLMLLGGLLTACQSTSRVQTLDPKSPESVHSCVKKLTDVIVYDIFSPPVASRIYTYTALAAYEAGRFEDPSQPSLTQHLNGFPAMPKPEAGQSYAYTLAGVKAFCFVAEKLTFSKDTIRQFEAQLLERFRVSVDEPTYERSVAFGEQIAKKIMERAAKDHYKETRGMERYSIKQDIEDKWLPTPPDYSDAVEPYWGLISPMGMDSASQFKPERPYPYSRNSQSPFWKEVVKVYETGNALDEEKKAIARFWDDNPFVSQHSGHLMIGRKKMTPGGHWMAIAGLAARQTQANWVKSAQGYALTASALLDGFISCWDEKYRSEYLRPVTVIDKFLNPRWESYLQTPPFPEYTSGHSVISASAASVLSQLYGANFAFHDTTEKEYGHGERSFHSFMEAAEQAGISRMYGGIHYEFSCKRGTEQGKKVGSWLLLKTGLSASLAQR